MSVERDDRAARRPAAREEGGWSKKKEERTEESWSLIFTVHPHARPMSLYLQVQVAGH